MRNRPITESFTLSDIHCHLLPDIDDGPRSVPEAYKALKKMADQGVTRVAFTPHFYSNVHDADDFLSRRMRSFESISGICDELKLQAVLGAEIKMHSDIPRDVIRSLTIGNSPYLLLEWPSSSYPLWGKNFVFSVMDQGITPIFAHIERYSYFTEKQSQLEMWKNAGALFQINAEYFISNKTRRKAFQLLKNGFCDIVAGDSHDAKIRPPCVTEAFSLIGNRFGEEYVENLLACADQVFQ